MRNRIEKDRPPRWRRYLFHALVVVLGLFGIAVIAVVVLGAIAVYNLSRTINAPDAEEIYALRSRIGQTLTLREIVDPHFSNASRICVIHEGNGIETVTGKDKVSALDLGVTFDESHWAIYYEQENRRMVKRILTTRVRLEASRSFCTNNLNETVEVLTCPSCLSKGFALRFQR